MNIRVELKAKTWQMSLVTAKFTAFCHFSHKILLHNRQKSLIILLFQSLVTQKKVEYVNQLISMNKPKEFSQ